MKKRGGGDDERKKKKKNLNPTRRLSAVHGAARGEWRETAVTSGCFEPLCVCACILVFLNVAQLLACEGRGARQLNS
jgi:hypothetical protein